MTAARKAADAKRMPDMRLAFKGVSTALAGEIERFGHAEGAPVYLFECSGGPQGHSDPWLQLDQDARCPYMTPRSRRHCEAQLVGIMAATASAE